MLLTRLQARIARSLVVLLCAGFIQSGLSAPAAHAAAPTEPTISSITSGATSLTVNMVTTGIDATGWRWSITKRSGVSCANSYGDGVIQSVGTLTSTISITSLTAGCTYSVKVAGFNGAIGTYAEMEKLVGGFTAGLNVYYKNEAGTSANSTHVPFTTGTCGTGTVTRIDYDYQLTGPSGCNTDGFTSYYVGYIKAPYTGSVTFRESSDDGFYLNIQGQNVIANGSDSGATTYNATGSITMVANEIYRIEAWHHDNSSYSSAKLYWDWSGQTTTIVPDASFATDPSVFSGTCPLGVAARCSAGSAYEIKLATGTNMDGQYWIDISGTPTLVYCIMNSSQGGGGWMLAMKGKNSSTTFTYNSSYWVNSTLTGVTSYPERYSSTDSRRNEDAKYAPFTSLKNNQIMVLYPDYTNGGGAYTATNTGNNGQNYGFSWSETITTTGSSIAPWTAYNSTTGWGGTSYNQGLSGGPTEKTTDPAATASCIASANTLTYLFLNANRCAFRQVSASWSSTESPYSAIGNGLFFSQNSIRFFGINYGAANTASSGQQYKARIGFGWNENVSSGEDTSNDGEGGIGIYVPGLTTMGAGSYNGCCSTQNGVSGAGPSSTQMAFELYVRNTVAATINGSNLRVVYKRDSSLIAGNGFSTLGATGTPTFRLSPGREGFSINSTTGQITVSRAIAAGDYTMTVAMTDTDGISSTKSVTVQVVSESSDTDTALSFNGSQYLTTSGTYSLWGDQTHEAWVRADSACTQTDSNKTAFGNPNFVVFCNSGYWWVSFYSNSNAWNGVQSNRKVVSGEWIHIAVVRSGTTVTMYFNNNQSYLYTNSTWANSYTQSTVKNAATSENIGGTGASTQYFTGLVDEVKVWDSARTLSQIWTGAHAQEDVGQANLLLYWDFNEGSGTAISRAQRSDNSFNLTPASNQWVSVANTSTDGPYTVVTFPRTLINSAGGWRSPDSITAITVTIVGGGGGGGGGFEGGGGGAGGFIETQVALTPKSIYAIKVGMGGQGTYNPVPGTNGETTTAFGLSAVGGGRGASEYDVNSANTVSLAQSGGSGGGGAWGTKTTSNDNFVGGSGTVNQGNAGGNNVTTGSSYLQGAGGGGAGAIGGAPDGTKGGNGGAGRYSNVLKSYLAGGGGGSHRLATTTAHQGLGGSGGGGASAYVANAYPTEVGAAAYGTYNTGGGGGAGMSVNGSLPGQGGAGGSGVVALRYITAFKPTYTPPTNTYLNVGMTETFTVNVAQDSATAVLTRTFRWESTTSGSNGTYSLLKQGTGAANAAFSWVPSDSSTSGSMYLYRVIVTDSDTAGLYIQDTSTAVYAVINNTLVLSGKNSITKTVNISKTETFTVTDGTPTYRYTLTPTSTNFWLDTSTAGSPKLKFSDTVTVGTYYETLTVIDSVSASIVQPLTIVVNPPPSFSANAAQVDSGTVLYLDAGNTTSYPGSGTTWTDISGRANHVTLNQNMGTTAYYLDGSNRTTGMTSNNITCTSALFNSSSLGSFEISTVGQCIYIPTVLPTSGTYLPVYSMETWVKRTDNQTAWNAVACTQYRNSGDQIPICLMWMGADTLVSAIFDGANWYQTSSYTIANKTWAHVVTTYNGTNSLNMYVNGSATAYSWSGTPANSWNSAKVNPGLLVGRKWDATSTMNGSIASLRIYNRVLTTAEIAQNYDASKGRFLTTQNKQAQSGKYGTTVNDTYTVTAGSESITATFTSNVVAGIFWDTSTARSIKLQLQDSLSAGTYTDTITVTDIYGSSTRIPLSFTIAKADTLTVWIDTPTALSYSGTNALFTPVLKVSGLVSSDTGTAVASIKYRPGGTSCATGGTCAIGDIGPGGGIVFITPSTSGGNGKYFEAAPFTWAGSDELGTNATYCSNSNLNMGATNVGIGWGDTNTSLAKTQCLGGAVGKVNTFNGSNNTGYSDWFIPSTNELTELAKVRDSAGLLKLGSNWTVGRYGYWSSTESSASVQASLVTSTWTIGGTSKSDAVNNFVRPVRMFSPCWTVDSCNSLATTTKPTNAGIYAITTETLTLTSGLLSNYLAIKYDTTTVTINKINQSPQNSTIFNAGFPETLTVYMTGGNGNGAISYTYLNAGTATGCATDYKKVYSTTVGTCNIQVVRLGDRNYNTDTATVYVFFTTFVNNQPSPQPGTGPNIALTGVNSVTLDSNVAPTISAVTYVAAVCTGGGLFSTCIPEHWEIIGAGFGAYDNTNTIVKFWRNKVLDWFPAVSGLNYVDSDTKIWIRQLPSGATTGKITVTTANGIAVSPDTVVLP